MSNRRWLREDSESASYFPLVFSNLKNNSQLAFTCSTSPINSQERRVKYVQS